jgi:hypothetical protein
MTTPEKHAEKSQPIPSNATPSEANPSANVPPMVAFPMEIAGRPLTGITGAGVSAQIASPTETANAALAEFTLASLRRGIVCGESPNRSECS